MRFAAAAKLTLVLDLLALAVLVVMVPASAAQTDQKPQAPVPAAQAPAPATAPTPASAPTAPTVSPQDQQTYNLLAFRAQIQAEAVAVLQKELDSTNAEIGRLVQRLGAIGTGHGISRDKDGRLIYVEQPKK